MMVKLLVVIAATFSTIISCPCNWEKIGSGCFLFVKGPATWDEARADCQKRGGDLAVPTCSNENKRIVRVAKDRGLNIPWIGLVRRYDKQFTTVCGVKPVYTNWAPSQPDYWQNAENCGHMYAKNRNLGKWNDIRCNRKYGYICEIKYPRCA